MRILKKSLAICLAAILALTAMCGCIVSADTITGTISAGKVTVTEGATEITVPVTITSASPIVVVRLAVEAGLTLKSASATAVDAEGNSVAMKNIVEDTDANLAEGIIIFDANDWNVPFTTATANLVYDVSAAKAGDVYDITPYALTTVEGSTYDEIGVVYTYEAGSITVESAECAHVAGEAVKENEVAADCDDAGSYDNVVYCSVCGEEMSRETVTVDALGHTEAEAVVENKVDATCDTEGSYDSVIYCSVCGEEISRTGVVVPATGEHTAADPVVENEEAADCANAGSYDTVVYCSVCNAEISRTTVGVPATGEHNYADGVCTVCGAEDPSVDVCDHTWKVVEATPATEDVKGSLTRTCADCGESEIVEVSYYARHLANSINASYASAITLEFNSRDDRLAEQGEYTDAFIRFEHTISSDNSLLVTYQPLADSYPTTKSSRACTTWAYEVKSTELTEVINANVFVEVNGVWFNGDVRGHSVRSYADTIIAGVEDSEKKLIVNMLRYGSKMQQFKGYNTENLADANLGEYEALITTTDPSIVDASSKENSDTTGIYITSKFYLDMASRTEAVLYARSDKYTGDNKDNFTIVASWKNANGADLSATYYNATYAAEDDLVYQNELNADDTIKANRYYFSFAELDSYDLRQMVTFNIYDGETEVSQVYTTSIESLIALGTASGTYGDAELAVYKAMINYSDASRAHFCS